MKKKFFAVILCSLLLVSSCGSQEESKTGTKGDNSLEFSNKKETAGNFPNNSETDYSGKKESSRKAYTISAANIYNLNDRVKIDDLDIKIKDAYYYKTLPESVNQEEVDYLNMDFDENGNIKEGTLYAFVDGEVTNTSSEMVIYSLNMAWFAELDDAGGVTKLTDETRYRADCKPGDLAGKDYFKCELQPNETLEFQTVYFIYEGMEKKELYYVINRYGDGPGYDGLKAVKLGQLGERK